MKLALISVVTLLLLECAVFAKKSKYRTSLEGVLSSTQKLEHERGSRWPIVVHGLQRIDVDDEKEIAKIVADLGARGIVFPMHWRHYKREDFLPRALKVARAQKKLGLPIVVDGTGIAYHFYSGDMRTAHVDKDGKAFFDFSFAKYTKIGCPFAVEFRYEEMRSRFDYFLDAYKKEGLNIDLWYADWEIDGPMEWNDGWENCKRCTRCRKNIPKIDDFDEFQKTLRLIRSDMQKRVFVAAMHKVFPKALVGNYGVNPHDGVRYWYDYFEKPNPKLPKVTVNGAKHRKWFHEFPLTGYNLSIPVIYPRYKIFTDYNYKEIQFRWFYNLLKQTTTSIVHNKTKAVSMPFVTHWTCEAPKKRPKNFEDLSPKMYQELLWHMLLRGHDGFLVWVPMKFLSKEVKLVQKVYAQSLKHREFLERGEPVLFEVPLKVSPVVSALRLGDKILLRRTDFSGVNRSINIVVSGKNLMVPFRPFENQVISLR